MSMLKCMPTNTLCVLARLASREGIGHKLNMTSSFLSLIVVLAD